MKKISQILLLSLVLPMFFFTNCKKSGNVDKQQKPNVSQEKVLRLIDGFKIKLNSPLKDGEEISLDSAAWLMEATVNETYARADNFRDVVHLDSTFINIDLSVNNTISTTDVVTAYRQMVDSISQHYYSITGEKGLIFVDIEVVSTQNGQVTIKITDVVTSPNYTPSYLFGTTDYWFWGWAQGKCDGSGQSVGQDAADKLAQHANWSIPVLAQSFYTDISETGWLYPSSNISTNGNPYGYGEFLVYQHSGNGSSNDCLTPEVMNYYLNCLKTIGTNFKPSGKDIIKYLCRDDFTVSSGYYHCHKASIRYGIPISAPAPAEDL